MRKLSYLITILITILFFYNKIQALELVIGEEMMKPGIVYIFEGAIKDKIYPKSRHLDKKETHVHIEARVNWHEKKHPKAAVPGGFIPYLYITAKIMNQKTKVMTFVDLLPHINLIDNFHYARNISLPGKTSDLYTIKFTISPPTSKDLAFHKDWVDSHGYNLTKSKTFTYKNINFKKIAAASR